MNIGYRLCWYNATATWLANTAQSLPRWFGMSWNIGSVLPAPQLLLYTAPKVFITGIRLWIFCRHQLILFGCCPQRNELHSRIVCDWLWPNVTYKECGCSKISSHSYLSLVFLQPSQSTRCCQLCAQRRWKKYQMLPAVCTKKVEEIIFQWHYQKKFGRSVWKSVMKYTVWYPASIFRM